MSLPDAINGAFEVLGGVSVWLNCLRMYRDRMVRGIDWRVTVFFTSWGLWNLYYYPHLGQWLSFAGGCVIVAANLAWVSMTLYFGAHRNDHAAK